MGREIRMVPPNWDHPKVARQDGREGFQPMFRRRFDDAFAEWLADFDRIRRGEFKSWESYGDDPLPLAAWLRDEGAPPDPAYYRPWTDEEATWFQVWETVSEGTPVTPPFATKAELVDYLIREGDFWQQKRWAEGNRFMQPEPPGYSRKAAEAFVGDGWAPSFVVVADPKSGAPPVILDGINSAILPKAAE